METKQHPILKKFIVLLLAGIVVLTYFPMDAFAAVNWSPGTKVYFREGDYLKGSDSNSRGNRYFYNNSSKYTNRWPNSSGSAWLKENCYALTTPRHSYVVKPTNGGTGKEAYCLEQNVQNPSNGNTKYTAKKWKESPFVGDLYSESVQKGIMLTLLYGKQSDSKASEISKLFGVSGANLDDWYMATQTIIWEYQQGLRTSASGGTKAYGITKPTFFSSSVSGRKSGSIYREMLKQMAKHEDVPSFATKKYDKNKPNSIKSIKMTYDDASKSWKSATLTDKKECEQTLRVMTSTSEDSNKENSKIKIVRQGDTNKYIIETKLDPSEWEGKITRGKKDVPELNRDDLLTWTANDGSHYQTLATGADDPVNFYFKLSKDAPVPPGEPGEPKLPSFELDVEKMDKNPGFDQGAGTSHTGMGDAALDSEISLYIDDELEDSMRLSVTGESEEPFYFTPWNDVSELTKEAVETKDKDGNLLYTDYYWRGTKTVKTKETVVPDGRFTESESGTGNGERDHGTITYYAHCRDDGPMDYNIQYENGTLTDEADIDEDNPQPMIDDKDDKAYVNDNYRGELQIVKTKDDQDPFTDKNNSDNGVKDYSTKSKWTIQLKSGGYEDCPYIRVVRVGPGEAGYDKFANTYRVVRDNTGTPADPDNPLTVSDKGQIKVLDLPYGTYEVKEITADEYGYVLETFEVTVSTDGQLISKEVNNKAKTNKIKVVKTNTETGKTVRWDADRTAFRIRYKGNPDLPDPTASPNYNRYLPNGSSYSDENKNYVFYCNKNGEITLPYEIEYGNYQIEELTVPEGYYVGSYDKDGKGNIADMGIIDGKGNVVQAPKDFTNTVVVRDDKGNRVDKFEGDNKTVYNKYTFKVTEQDAHVDGDDYITYYAIIPIANNPVKGKIEINKYGEGLAGWNRGSDGGYSIWKSVWDKITLKDTKFEIYAAKDIRQSDGVIPIKAFDSKTDKQIDLAKVSRDHADIAGAKEVWQVSLENGELIKQTSYKDKGAANKTQTEYLIGATNGASYKESFTKTEDGMTYKYTVEYAMNYAKGGFNYTDVHVRKESIADNYVPKIDVTSPVLKSGDLEVGFVTMNYAGGNRVTMNRLPSETGDEFTGVIDDYDPVKAEVVEPKIETVEVPDETQPPDEEGNYPTKEEEQVTNAPDVPEGWTKASDGWDAAKKDAKNFFIEKTGADGGKNYQIWINDGELKWADCDADGKFYKSYTQEWYFTAAQHYKSEDAFTFEFDGLKMLAKADHAADTATTEITGFDGVTPEIKTSNIYTHTTEGNVTTFIGTPTEEAPVYFLTHDGIRTEMFLSGRLSHTKVTVTQSQLYKFKETYPMVQWFNGDEYDSIDWNKDMKPDNNTFEWVKDENNYIKAERHEVGKDNKEVYYTIDIVSNNEDANKGFKITYPDTTECVPVISEGGDKAKLLFESVDDTMVYPIGSPVETITTGLDGIATSSNLPLGEYWVREISSAAGHVNSGQWKKFTLEYKDQYTPLIWDTATFENKAVNVKIDLEKLFETAYESKEYQTGNGAVFGIYTAEKITADTATEKKVDKKSIPADTLVGRMVVSNGQASADIKLPLGKYYVKEISAPTGWKTNNTKYYFDAVDILTADTMNWHYKDIGVSGLITQDGKQGVTIDFDTLYRFNAAKVNIDGKDYNMDTSFAEEGSNVSVAVMDGRTNTQIRIKDGQSTTIRFENGATMVVKADGQTYTATLDGKAPTKLETGAEGNENFVKTTEGSKTIIKYTPKVTKTNWLSEVTYKYAEPKKDAGDEEKAKLTSLLLTSPEGTSAVKADVSYDYGKATLTLPTGTAASIVKDGENVDSLTDPVVLERIVNTPVMDKETGEQKTDKDGNPLFDTKVQATKAVINFVDGVTYTVEFDKAGNFYMSAAGEVDKNLDMESTLTVDGKAELPKLVNLKNTTAKTYARNNTTAGVLNITINSVKNDHTPDNPTPPPGPGPSPSLPSISTTAMDSDTLDHISKADKKVTIIDTVVYNNLTPGKEYVLKGTLMDKATGKLIKVDDKEVTAEKNFTPERADGAVELTFTLDGKTLAGKTTVVFESLYLDKKEVAKHTDIDDAGQTIHFPKIKTSAVDSKDQDQILDAAKKVTIVDMISYTNLIPGKEYTISGVLMDKDTGKALLIDGKKVTATKTFTPDTADGSIDMTFTFGASKLGGKITVVFETLKYDGKEVAVHKDLQDKGQTVKIKEKIGEVDLDIDKKPSETPGGEVDLTTNNNGPQTGDSTLIWPYIALLVIAIGLVTLLIAKRKKNKQNK